MHYSHLKISVIKIRIKNRWLSVSGSHFFPFLFDTKCKLPPSRQSYMRMYVYIQILSSRFFLAIIASVCMKRRKEKEDRIQKKNGEQDRRHIWVTIVWFFLSPSSLAYSEVDVDEYVQWVKRRHCCPVLRPYTLIYVYRGANAQPTHLLDVISKTQE